MGCDGILHNYRRVVGSRVARNRLRWLWPWFAAGLKAVATGIVVGGVGIGIAGDILLLRLTLLVSRPVCVPL